MTLLTVDELREHITTSLVDDALERLLDDAEAAIEQYAGPVASAVDLVDGGVSKIVLSRPVDAAGDITTIVERSGRTSPVTLAVDDWALRGRYVLERVTGGTNSSSYWRGPVSVTYTPVDDTATRKMVQVDLIKLAISANPGLASETVGAWTQTFASLISKGVPELRGDILSRLRETAGFLVV